MINRMKFKWRAYIVLALVLFCSLSNQNRSRSTYLFNSYYLVYHSLGEIDAKLSSLDQKEKIDYQTFTRKDLRLVNFQSPGSWDQDCILLVDSIDADVSIVRLLKVTVDLPKESDSAKYKLLFEQHILSEFDWCGN